MNILILTSPEHEAFLFTQTSENREHLIFIINNKADFEKFAKSFSYDIGISYMYLHRVPKEQLTKTWINFHPGLLPAYKGRNLCYHALMNGAKSFGATAHYMDEDFDTGCIIETFDFPVDPSWTAQDLHDKTMEESRRLFERLFPLILTGKKFGCTANEGGRYYKKAAIQDVFSMPDGSLIGNFVRAVTYGEFYPRLKIGGVLYKIVRDE